MLPTQSDPLTGELPRPALNQPNIELSRPADHSTVLAALREPQLSLPDSIIGVGFNDLLGISDVASPCHY